MNLYNTLLTLLAYKKCWTDKINKIRTCISHCLKRYNVVLLYLLSFIVKFIFCSLNFVVFSVFSCNMEYLI